MRNFKLLYKWPEPVIKFYNVYPLFATEAKYRTTHRKRRLGMSARVAYIAKVSDRSHLKILIPKQILNLYKWKPVILLKI